MEARVVLISKKGCHLCLNARETIERVCSELGVKWTERFIHDDPALAIEYFESVPVTLVDGRTHDRFRVDEARLRQALSSAPRA